MTKHLLHVADPIVIILRRVILKRANLFHFNIEALVLLPLLYFVSFKSEMQRPFPVSRVVTIFGMVKSKCTCWPSCTSAAYTLTLKSRRQLRSPVTRLLWRFPGASYWFPLADQTRCITRCRRFLCANCAQFCVLLDNILNALNRSARLRVRLGKWSTSTDLNWEYIS